MAPLNTGPSSGRASPRSNCQAANQSRAPSMLVAAYGTRASSSTNRPASSALRAIRDIRVRQQGERRIIIGGGSPAVQAPPRTAGTLDRARPKAASGVRGGEGPGCASLTGLRSFYFTCARGEVESHVHEPRLTRYTFAHGPEAVREVEHARVLGQHRTPELDQPAPPRLVEQVLHERAADTAADQVRIDDQRELGPVRRRSDVEARLGANLAVRIGRDVGGALVLADIAEAFGILLREIVHAMEHAQAHLFRRQPRKAAAQCGDVVGADRAYVQHEIAREH